MRAVYKLSNLWSIADNAGRALDLAQSEIRALGWEIAADDDTPKISQLNLSNRGYGALADHGIYTAGMLACFEARDIRRWPGIGEKTIAEYREALAAHGLAFQNDDWSPAQPKPAALPEPNELTRKGNECPSCGTAGTELDDRFVVEPCTRGHKQCWWWKQGCKPEEAPTSNLLAPQ